MLENEFISNRSKTENQRTRNRKTPFYAALNTTLLAPALDLLGELLPLVANSLHHGLDLLAVLGTVAIGGEVRLGVGSEICVVNGDHHVHDGRQLVRQPLFFVSSDAMTS
jgi:hypothetical protein